MHLGQLRQVSVTSASTLVAGALLASALLASGCHPADGSTSADEGGAGGASGAGAGGQGGRGWALLPWQSPAANGDPLGDCAAGDAACSADIAQLSVATSGTTLHVLLEAAAPLPDAASFEVLLIPRDTLVDGHSLRWQDSQWWYWHTDCASARHVGCHWYTEGAPDGFSATWVEPPKLLVEMDVSAWGFDALTELMIGVAAAPFAIAATADYTDRYPDELLVTGQDIGGLAAVPLNGR